MAKLDGRYQRQKQAWLAHIEAVEAAIHDRNQRIEALEKALEDAHTPQEGTDMTTYDITLPPEPEGPVWDKKGDKWEREGSYWERNKLFICTWKELLADCGPVTDYPPCKEGEEYRADELDNLPAGSLVCGETHGKIDQYSASLGDYWITWYPPQTELELWSTLMDGASKEDPHRLIRVGWPTIPDGYTGALSDLLLIGEDE